MHLCAYRCCTEHAGVAPCLQCCLHTCSTLQPSVCAYAPFAQCMCSTHDACMYVLYVHVCTALYACMCCALTLALLGTSPLHSLLSLLLTPLLNPLLDPPLYVQGELQGPGGCQQHHCAARPQCLPAPLRRFLHPHSQHPGHLPFPGVSPLS